MLQILINTSIIWLCSLLAYELLLKKETFHRLNRYYLLFTFIAGIALPLLPWEQQARFSSYQEQEPAPAVLVNGAAPAVTTATATIQPEQSRNWLLILYVAGVGVSTLILLRDLLRLRALYRRAVITRSGPWTIAETGVSHGPFSFGKIIFACSREQYTDQQWAMLLQHEQQHYRYRHILDLVLMQVAMMAIWFHPLVYIYRQKLRLLHEYEADSTRPEDLQTYGRFLLEQAALSAAPAMTHAFNFSPLKNRIRMMTRNTSKRRVQYRLLLVLPMLAGFMYCCSCNSVKASADRKGNKVTLKDNTVDYSGIHYDTVAVGLPGQPQKKEIIATPPLPEKLNGQTLEVFFDYTVFTDTREALSEQYLSNQLQKVLPPLPDAVYHIALSGIVINKEGRVVHYNCTGLRYNAKANLKPQNKDSETIDPGIRKTVDEQIATALLNKTVERSAGGKINEPMVLAYDFDIKFRIENHHVLPY